VLRTTLYSFEGRIGRLRYFGYGLLAVLLNGIIMGIGAGLATETPLVIPGTVLASAGFVSMVWCGVALAAKRLHDMDLSAHHLWWIYGLSALGGVLQGLSHGFAVLLAAFEFGVGIWLLFKRGTDGPNRFGPPAVPSRG
jgi:uncharacterized membrane protein YhaH (DUF805 family)